MADDSIWQYIVPLAAGVASAATPGLARGVGGALGAYGALQQGQIDKLRLQQLKKATSTEDALGSETMREIDAGALPDVTGQDPNAVPPASRSGVSTPAGSASDEGTPKQPVQLPSMNMTARVNAAAGIPPNTRLRNLDPSVVRQLKNITAADPRRGSDLLWQLSTQMQRPTYSQFPKPRPGQKIHGTTAEGLEVTAQEPTVQDAEHTLLDPSATPEQKATARQILNLKTEKSPFSVINDPQANLEQKNNAWRALRITHPDIAPANSILAFGTNGEPLAFDPRSKNITRVQLPAGVSGIQQPRQPTSQGARDAFEAKLLANPNITIGQYQKRMNEWDVAHGAPPAVQSPNPNPDPAAADANLKKKLGL